MKKILSVLLCLTFTASLAFSQEVFLSLTKYNEDIRELPTNVTVIDRQQIETSRTGTLGELLQNEVSVNFKTYGSAGSASGISIRGASGTQTLVLIDGRRVNDIGLGTADFTNIPAANIERVEIIRGAGAAIYGTGAFGGVVNVITKRAASDSPIVDLDLSYGSFNTFSPAVTGAYAAEKTAALVSLSHLSSDGYRDAEFVNYNAFFSGSAAAWEKSRFSLTGNIYQSEYHPKGSLTYYTPNDVQEDNLKYAKLDYDYVFEEMSLKVSGYASESKRKYRSPALSKDGYTANTYGTQADFIYKNILLAGAEWWQDNYKREDLLTDTTMTDKSKENTAFYVQANIDIGKLRIIPGLRGDIDSEYGDVVTPAISAIYSVNDKVKVSANSGRVWRAPTFSELYDDYPSWWMYGNPGLKPEYGISSDIGAEYSYGKIKAACTAFYIASKDLIKNITDPVTFEMRPQNIAKARQYGLELEGGYIMNSWLKHNFNYTFLKAENSDTGEILPYSPESAVNYSVTVKPVEKLSVCAQAIYKSGQKVSGAPDLDGYFTLDLNVSYRINENFTCWVKGFNITDTDYQMYSDYPMPGATVYAGINFKFWK